MAKKFTFHGDGVLSYVRVSDGKRVYFARYSYQGRPITEKVGLDEDQARGLAKSRRRLIDEDPAYVPPNVKRKRAARGRIRFNKFVEEFHKNHGALRRSATTYFEPMERQAVAEFGTVWLDELKPGRIQSFVAKRSKTVEPVTVNHSIRFLKNLLGRAVEWGYLTTNPAAKIRYMHEPPTREVFLSQYESDKLLELAQKHVVPAARFALLTGCRRGEILGLTWDAVDLKRRTIHLRHTKSGDARALPVGDDLLVILKALPRHVKHNHVFSYQGEPLKSLQGSWEDAREKLAAAVRDGDAEKEIPRNPERAAVLDALHFHDLRHTWASRQVAVGTDLYTLMKLGGWRSIEMVQRYAHFSPDYLRAAANRLNGTAGTLAAATQSETQVAAKVAGLCAS
ncbi:MAG: site-specific integrase [Acidobacteriia bacterium]|nr:site-specific integrase [Terriglobia bacterium]